MSGCIPHWMKPVLRKKLFAIPPLRWFPEQIKARAGETSLETAISLQKTGASTPAQQAIHLALPVLESKTWPSAMVDLLTEAKSFAAEGTSFTELGGEINAQIKRGDLLYVDVAKAMAQACWFPVRRMRQKKHSSPYSRR